MIPRYKYKLSDFGKDEFSICDETPSNAVKISEAVKCFGTFFNVFKNVIKQDNDDVEQLRNELETSKNVINDLQEENGSLKNKLGRALAAKNRYKGKCEVLKDDNRDCKNEYLGFQKCAALIK